jgi:N-acetyl-anhydromuramoyl-L-alanine amidase
MPRRDSRNHGAPSGQPGCNLAHWQEGWLRGAQRLPSPNFSVRPAGTAVSLVVLHSISLPPGQYGGAQIQALFTNQLDWDAHPYFQTIQGVQVSAHFLIERGGALWQFVSCDDRAWHAGVSVFQGRENCNDFSIGIELEGLEGESFAPAQYAALSQVCIHLRGRYPIASVVGHEHIAPGRKLDPGSGFDWHLLAQSVAWTPQSFPFFSGEKQSPDVPGVAVLDMKNGVS